MYWLGSKWLKSFGSGFIYGEPAIVLLSVEWLCPEPRGLFGDDARAYALLSLSKSGGVGS